MPDDQVQEVKDRIDVVDLVGSYVPLKKAGATWKGLCPFHKEKTPSFTVNPERQIFKCFGCNEGGDVLTFVQKMEGLTFPEALEMLADRAGVKLDHRKAPAQYQREKDEKSALYRLNAAAAKFFHTLLTDHPSATRAREYLAGRDIRTETIAGFQIGFAPSTPALSQWLAKHGVSAAHLRAGGSPERFRNRIMFPIRDPLGNVLGFTGRVLPGDESGPKYYNTPETPIFRKSRVLYGIYEGKQAIRERGVAVLVEGQVDVVLSHQAGVRLAIASSGTAFTLDHLTAIGRYASKLILAFDADQAGVNATKKAIALAAELDLSLRVVRFPEGVKDAGEAIERDPKLWATALAEAQPAFDWLVDTAIAEQVGSLGPGSGQALDGSGKKAVAKAVLPVLARLPDPVEQAHQLTVLSRRLAVPERALQEAIARTRTPKALTLPSSPPPAKTVRSLVEQLAGLLVLNPAAAERVPEAVFPPGTLARRLYETVKACYNPEERQTTADVVRIVSSRLSETDRVVLPLLLAEVEQLLGPDTDADAVITELATRLTRDANESVKQSIAERIAAAEAAGNRDQVKQLIVELQATLKG
ncbi:DNA primase [Candidatus Berkelbacteria bacterium]|nr:DNA primase [Candidatus Berkelbacteria bacterium]